MKLAELYKHLKQTLSEVDSRYVIQKRTGYGHTDIISKPEMEVDPTAAMDDLKRIEAGEPLSRIYGEREFWGLNFGLSSETLDPRIDTETLIEKAIERLKNNPPEWILDLGTGSGCILLSLLHEFPNANGLGIELSFEAVKAAKRNAENLGLSERAYFLNGDWAESIHHKFDLVVSNPPYISSKVIPELDENVQKYDPILALDGGSDGLQAYKKIFSELFYILKPGGFCFLEIGFDQEESVMRLSKESRFSNVSSYADSVGQPRVVEIFFEG